MSDELLFDQSGPLVMLTLNRPDRRNPLGLPGDGAWFAQAAARINEDLTVRCVLLTGEGSAFSAGGDLKAMQARSGEFAGTPAELRERYRSGIHRMVSALWSIRVPVIAAVNGPAIGLGNDIACLADIRLAGESARFGASFVSVGLVPGDGGAWILSRVLGVSRAAELLFTGKVINATQAAAWGLVSRVVPDQELLASAREFAQQICAQAPQALRMTKQLLRASLVADFPTVMELSAALQAIAHTTGDHREALEAFFAKRPPVFTGS